MLPLNPTPQSERPACSPAPLKALQTAGTRGTGRAQRRLHLLSEHVLLSVAAAEVEACRAAAQPLLYAPAAVLPEASEWCNASAGSHEDKWHERVGGQPEVRLGDEGRRGETDVGER